MGYGQMDGRSRRKLYLGGGSVYGLEYAIIALVIYFGGLFLLTSVSAFILIYAVAVLINATELRRIELDKRKVKIISVLIGIIFTYIWYRFM